MKKLLLLIGVLSFWSFQLHAHPSWGIQVDKQRNIYFADLTHYGKGTVWKLTHNGKLIALLKDFHAHNVSLDKNENLVTADGEKGSNRMVRVFNNATIQPLVKTDDWDTFFGGNSTYSKQDKVFFGLKKNIWEYLQNGKAIKFIDYNFNWIQSIYVDDDGYVYVADKAVNNGSLYKVSENSVEILATNLITKLDKPVDIHDVALLGITKGCDEKMYVAELVGKRVVRINSDKTTETFYKSEGDWYPTGIDFFAGDAYILEFRSKGKHRGPRITKIDESGKMTRVFEFNEHKTDSAKQNVNKLNYLLSFLDNLIKSL